MDIYFIDIETNIKGEILLYGIKKLNGEYFYFRSIKEFNNWYNKLEKKTKIYVYNIEFDYWRIIQEYLLNQIEIKFNAFFNQAGCVYGILNGIYWLDLEKHFDSGLKYFGEIIGLEKLPIDYKNLSYNQYLIIYNKRDLELTELMFQKLSEIYKFFGCNKIKGTISSQAFDIYIKRYCDIKFGKIEYDVLKEWRAGYYGGWNECFKIGKFKGSFAYIDVNSLYPSVMITEYPDPYKYRIVQYYDISENDFNKYWLGIDLSEGNINVYNSVEHYNLIKSQSKKVDYFYIFDNICYPFKLFIYHMYKLRLEAKDTFTKKIYKRLMNSLYGKFGQTFNYSKILKVKFDQLILYKNLIEYEEILPDIYKVVFEDKGKYWNNILWALFTTAKARAKMRRDYDEFIKRGIEIFYIDTDCFIINKKNIDKINEFFGAEIGKYKIEREAKEIEIKGKKLYRFDDDYRCKGVPKEKAREFFEKGKIEYDEMVKIKTALRKNLLIGSWIKKTKEDITNKVDNNEVE